MARGEPTGSDAVDALLRAAVAALVAAAASRARRWAWLLAAGAAAVAAAPSGVAVVAFAALGMATGATSARRRGPVLGAVVGALVAQALLRLTWPRTTGATAVVALVAVTVLGASAWANMRDAARRRAGLAMAGVGVAMAVTTGLWAVAALSARPDAMLGIAAGEQGLAAVRAGDAEAGAASLEQAGTLLTRTHRALAAWWARPALAVPVVAHHARAGERLSAAAAGVARSSAAVARAAASPGLQPRGGAVDTGAIRALGPPIAASREALGAAADAAGDVRSPWLVPPLSARVDRFEEEVARARPEADALALAVEVTPALLGDPAPRRYFVAIQSPAEQRASGGIIGNFVELRANAGRLAITRSGSHSELNPPAGGTYPVDAPPDYVARYGSFGPGRFFLNAGLSPDFPTVARILEDLYARAGGARVDGVIAVDPVALSGLLRLTGPVPVPGWPEPLTADTAARVLLHDHYVVLGGEARERFQAAAAATIFDRLTSGDLPGPAEFVRALAPAVRGGHLQLHSRQTDEQLLFEWLGADGAIPPVRGDFLQVVTQNAGESKIDWFQRRAVTYVVTWEPGVGRLRARVQVALTNGAPPGGLPEYVIGGTGPPPRRPGQSSLWVSLYTPHDLQAAILDGEAFPMVSERELGRQVHSGFVTLGPGQTAVLEVSLAGLVPQGDRYVVDIGHQPTITPDELTVRVRPWGDERIIPVPPLGRDGERGAVAHLAQDSPVVLSATTEHERQVRRRRYSARFGKVKGGRHA